MRLLKLAAPAFALLAIFAAPARAAETPLASGASVLEAVAAQPSRSGKYWDGDPRRRPGYETAVAAVSARRGKFAPKTEVPEGVLIPDLGRDASAASASCREALKDSAAISGLCAEHPAAAAVLAGLLDAVKEQFGSLQALSMNLVMMLLGLALAALSGLGLVAKLAVSLVAVAGLADALGPLLKNGWAAVSRMRDAPEGSVERATAARSIGKASGSLLLIGLMAVAGWKAGKTAAGQQFTAKMTAGLSTALNNAGVSPALVAIEAQIPAPVTTALNKMFAPAPLKAAAEPPPPMPRPFEELLMILDQRPDRAARFLSARKFTQRFTALPEGIPERMRPGFDSIRRLLGDQGKVATLMQELETEVVERSLRTGEPLELAREAILAAAEERHGFKAAFDLPARIYDRADWRAMLRDGAMFKDSAFKDLTRAGAVHGYETHRLQWNLVMREMESRPSGFGEVSKASDYFKFLGGLDDAKLDWKNSGIGYNSTAWFELFDSTQKNFSSPEFLRDAHAYFPGLGRWY